MDKDTDVAPHDAPPRSQPAAKDPGRAAADAVQALFHGLPLPVCLVDASGRLVAMNRHAAAYWATDPAALLGQPAMEALGIVPVEGAAASAALRPADTPPRRACRVQPADGQVHHVSLIYAPLEGTSPALAAFFIVEGAAAAALPDVPEWALRDPVTGLGNRALWERQAASWDSRPGCVAFFDLDDLKEVNDLHGHLAGDRLLAATGSALVARTPPEALAVRYGGDEFVVALPCEDAEAAEAWAARVVREVASLGTVADLPIVPRLSHGVAAFAPGGLRAAVQRADDLLYARKGVLLPAASGGRIILTREGRAALRGPGDDQGPSSPGAFSQGFGPSFAAHLRAQFARATAQAEDFVAFAAPVPGTAVLEVGAGSGRITFDGGLAQRVGPHGQLLVTDASAAQVQAARRRARELGLDWVRFLQATAEDLPLAAGTADMALGVLFLQFTDPVAALRELARVLRPGGRLVLGAGLPFPWPPVWQEILAPVRAELRRQGLPQRDVFAPADSVRAWVRAAGLELEREVVSGPEQMDFPDPEVAAGFWRQNGLVPLLLRGVAPVRVQELQEEFQTRIHAVFARSTPPERRIAVGMLHLTARKPAGVGGALGGAAVAGDPHLREPGAPARS
jgi:diguanylate cyclase (GGDEF)-like protein